MSVKKSDPYPSSKSEFSLLPGSNITLKERTRLFEVSHMRHYSLFNLMYFQKDVFSKRRTFCCGKWAINRMINDDE